MDQYLEQRANIKFCLKIGKTATETFNLLRIAYGDESMSRSQSFEWFAKFKEGETSIYDKNRTGRPAEVRNDTCIQKVKEIIDANRRQTVRDVCLSAGISQGSCYMILRNDLGLK